MGWNLYFNIWNDNFQIDSKASITFERVEDKQSPTVSHTAKPKVSVNIVENHTETETETEANPKLRETPTIDNKKEPPIAKKIVEENKRSKKKKKSNIMTDEILNFEDFFKNNI